MSDVTSYQVTGDWRHVVDDGMVDLDDLPDEALPTGSVRFAPVGPSVAVAGDPGVGYTFGPVTALVAAGELRDLQGRPGIKLAGTVGGETVRWRAVVRLSWHGQEVAEWTIVFDLDGDLRLSAERPDDGVGLPHLVVSRAAAAAERAVAAAVRAETAAGEVDAAISGAADAVVQAVEQDRVRAEQAREDAKGHALAAGEDREQTGLDREQTGLDRAATGEDRVATGEDRVATGEDREATNLDREQTGLDRTQTGLDRTDAAGFAGDAETEAGRAKDEADRAQVHAAAAEAASNRVVQVWNHTRWVDADMVRYRADGSIQEALAWDPTAGEYVTVWPVPPLWVDDFTSPTLHERWTLDTGEYNPPGLSGVIIFGPTLPQSFDLSITCDWTEGAVQAYIMGPEGPEMFFIVTSTGQVQLGSSLSADVGLSGTFTLRRANGEWLALLDGAALPDVAGAGPLAAPDDSSGNVSLALLVDTATITSVSLTDLT